MTEHKQHLREFQSLLAQYKTGNKVVTKEQEAEKQSNKILVEQASTYTLGSIVKNLADLQLNLAETVQNLLESFNSETKRLEDIQKATFVGRETLVNIHNIQVAAEALYVLEQTQKSQLNKLEQENENTLDSLKLTQNEWRQAWAKEDSEFETKVTSNAERQAKERQQEQNGYEYNKERKIAQDNDLNQSKTRFQERKLADMAAKNTKDWTEREAVLAENAEKYAENTKKVEVFPTELEEATKKAREEAIKDAHSDAKVKAELQDKEWEATKQSSEMQIMGLEQLLEQQKIQIAELNQQLQSALQQAQALNNKAFQ